MFSRFLLFFGAAGAGLCATATGRRGFGARFPAKPCSFVNGHHVFGTKGARPARTWCTIPRKTLFFRQRAPRLWDQRRCRRAGRGASPPANPCSFVDGHHVFGAKGASGEPDVVLHPPANPCSFVDGHHVFGTKGAAGEPDVVLHSPQNLALSSTGTTSLGSKAPPASVPISISHRRKELTTGPRGRAFRRQFLPISTGIAGIRDSQESC